MKKIFCLLAIFSSCQVWAGGDTSVLARRFQDLAEHYTAKGLPGLVLSIKSNDIDTSLSAGFANLESMQQMQTGHKLMVASVTKMFMAVLTLKLSEQGKLDLDQPITEFNCGQMFRKIRNADKITINHLLNHTSGLPDFIKHPAFFLNVLDKPGCDWRQKDLLKFLKNQRPLFQPGEKAAYSNSNFLLLTVILDNEFRGETDHLAMMDKLILQPLKMNNTIYKSVRTVPDFAATGYAELYNDGNIINLDRFNTGGSGNGYSGIYSTAGDLQKFIRALFAERTLLSDSSLSKMTFFINDSEEPGVAFGLGIWQDFTEWGERNTGIGHRGRDIAYSSEVWWFPRKQVSVVVLSNSGAVMDSKLTDIYKEFRKELFGSLLQINQP